MRNLILMIGIFSSGIGHVFADDLALTSAIKSDFGKTQRSPEQIAASQVITLLAKQNGAKDFLSLAYTNLGSGSIWYRLYDDFKLYAVDISSKQYIGSWLLNTYPDLTIMSGEIPRGANILHDEGVYNSPYWKVTDPSLPQTGKDVVHREKHTKPASTHGCFDINPLRYGDIEGDGKKELIVTRDGDFIVSSPSKKSVIFAANWFMNDDVVINNDPGTVLPVITPEERAALPKDTPQYGAYSNLLKYIEGKNYPAWRSFAKLYFGDFDADKAQDIVMWRKLYESNLMGSPQKGFSKKAELWVHYKVVNGEYKKQPTDSATIKTWLTAKQLTWQKGYPSKSECKGQEGQLIPEMHDPLLNDPDVLK